MSTHGIRTVIATFDRAVDTGDVQALRSVCHPDMVTHSFGPTAAQGLTGMQAFVTRRAASGGVGHWDQVITVTDEQHLVQFGTRTFHWPGGPFRGFDAPSGTFTRDCAFMFRIIDGLITDRWAIRDDLAMLAQLGAIQPPRPTEIMHGTNTYTASPPAR